MTAKNWLGFWDGRHRIYVNDRHRAVHYRRVADDILGVLPRADAAVLDHGCGEALEAHRVAERCGHLYLCDAAPSVRARLAERLADRPNATVLAPDEVSRLPDSSLDLVVANSLLQYVSKDEFAALAALWRRKLRAGGLLVLADILPEGDSVAADIRALLAMGWRNGFFLAAVAGLTATFFSDYRRLRRAIGLTRYGESDMIARLTQLGFKAGRRDPNFGFNPRRMTFVAQQPTNETP